MAKEIKALGLNNTWTLEELLIGKKSINCKWVCKVKNNSNGNVEWYKACLLIHGDQHIEGSHYRETFATMAKLKV